MALLQSNLPWHTDRTDSFRHTWPSRRSVDRGKNIAVTPAQIRHPAGRTQVQVQPATYGDKIEMPSEEVVFNLGVGPWFRADWYSVCRDVILVE